MTPLLRAAAIVLVVFTGALAVAWLATAPARSDALCDAMKARFGPGYPCLNVPTNTFTPTAPTAPTTSGGTGSSGGGPQAGSNIGPGPGEGNGTPIVPVPGQGQQTPTTAPLPDTNDTATQAAPGPTASPTVPPRPSATPAPSSTPSTAPPAPTTATQGETDTPAPAPQQAATTGNGGTTGAGTQTALWLLAGAAALVAGASSTRTRTGGYRSLAAANGYPSVGAALRSWLARGGSERVTIGSSQFTLLNATPAGAVVHPRPPQYVVPPGATAPVVQYHGPDTSNSAATTEGGGSGPDTSGGGQSGGAGTTYNDTPTDSGTYGGGTGTGTTGGGSTGTGTSGPSNSSTSPTSQTPPPQTAPTTPPSSGDDPVRAQTVGFLTDILKPIIGSAEAAAALAFALYQLGLLAEKYGTEWLRQHPLDTHGLLASQLPAWVIARIGDLDKAITRFFSDNKEEPRVYKRHDKHNKSMPTQGPHGSEMDLPDDEAQRVLDRAVGSDKKGKKLWGAKDGKVYEFVPDNTGGWHGYIQEDPKTNVPANVKEKLLNSGQITKKQRKEWRGQ
ncbi:hypothetical protein ACXVUM_06525 [Williamsia sp. SKLECPSW1]